MKQIVPVALAAAAAATFLAGCSDGNASGDAMASPAAAPSGSSTLKLTVAGEEQTLEGPVRCLLLPDGRVISQGTAVGEPGISIQLTVDSPPLVTQVAMTLPNDIHSMLAYLGPPAATPEAFQSGDTYTITGIGVDPDPGSRKLPDRQFSIEATCKDWTRLG